MMSFEEKTRYNIRLAEKKGVKVVEESNDVGSRPFINYTMIHAKEIIS